MAGDNPFVVGTTSGYAPFVSLNEKGEYEGFDIDLANLLAKKLNRKLVIKDLGSMPSLMIGLKQGKVNALIWGISITEARSKQMDIVYYQGEKITTLPMIFWESIPANLNELKDLSNSSSICVETGSYQESVLERYESLKLKNVDSINDVLMELKFGKASAAPIDNSLVNVTQKRFPQIRVKYFDLPKDAQSLGNGICINKNNAELTDQVAKAVKELREEGKIRELEVKWNLATI